MENRIRSNMARGRAVVNDSAIQGLFLRLTEFHSQVLQRMHKLDEDRGMSCFFILKLSFQLITRDSKII